MDGNFKKKLYFKIKRRNKRNKERNKTEGGQVKMEIINKDLKERKVILNDWDLNQIKEKGFVAWMDLVVLSKEEWDRLCSAELEFMKLKGGKK